MFNFNDTGGISKDLSCLFEDEDVSDVNLLKKFVRHFFNNTCQNCVIEDAVMLKGLAKDSFRFFYNRSKSSSKVRVFNPDINNTGWNSNFTVIELINDDMPFLVDSLTEEIKSSGFTIYMRINSFISVDRNEKGDILSICDSDDSKGAKNESFIHFAITKILDESILKALEKSIESLLNKIKVCVSDFSKMLEVTDNVVEKIKVNNHLDSTYDADEVSDLMVWLKNHNFIFLGYKYVDSKKKDVKSNRLGLCKFYDCQSSNFFDQNETVCISKSNIISVVHRRQYMDLVKIAIHKNSKIEEEHYFYGIFTSLSKFQDVNTIPIIRKKIEYIKMISSFPENGYSLKAVIFMIQNTPRYELFHISHDNLYKISMGMLALSVLPRLRFFVYDTKGSDFVNCILFIPREQFSTVILKKIKSFLSSEFKGDIVSDETVIDESNIVRLQCTLKVSNFECSDDKILVLEKKLSYMVKDWRKNLHEELVSRLGESDGDRIYNMYGSAFGYEYRHAFDSSSAFHDIMKISDVVENYKSSSTLYITKSDKSGQYNIKTYFVNSDWILSDMIPVIENMGAKVIDHYSYKIHVKGVDIWLHHFIVESISDEFIDFDCIKDQLEETLDKLWCGKIENDKFNALVSFAGISWREVVLVRSISKYLKQIKIEYGQRYMQDTVIKYPEIVKLLVKIFNTKFCLDSSSDRDVLLGSINMKLDKLFSNVINVADDSILNKFKSVILSIVRTNFFAEDAEGSLYEFISFKIDPSKIVDIPLPCPYFEIFVYSNEFEAVHLRGGKVARGGLRWSDRTEDFRSEVLGLMKAQMPKNTVIIPVGSKGGFVLKGDFSCNKKFLEAGVKCYKNFLTGMLCLTDNVIDGEFVSPRGVKCYDDFDPYLVVAADKGTATFSDYANSISEKFNFWLGDAFASGGKYGYDHKKMGITAKGAWISVKHHFFSLGLDPSKDELTVIGIGDMSGDVFGNGMLLSDKIKLIAAFNHIHIFIDPNPDIAKSFEERTRLFNKDRSTWEDYDVSLISKGGGIFSRSLKAIDLSPEIKSLFFIKEDSLSPDELIFRILKADVDLLWNGGIGTYVKSSKEDHSEVHDKANDKIRVNGKDLMAKVVVEGGNLGCTQLGRIEASQNKCLINTDFIDNSGGVACSDMEVNIKIALEDAVSNSGLSISARNKLLSDMTEEVEELVLVDNVFQNKALTTSCYRAVDKMDHHLHLIHSLERRGILNRAVEFIPSDEEFIKLKAEGCGLVRPQLAVLLSYAKMALYDDICKSTIPDDPYFEKYLINYFPESMRVKFKKEILHHQLRREIIATCITNDIINRTGIAFLNHVVENTGLSSDVIARIYFVVKEIFDLQNIWDELQKYDSKVSVKAQDDVVKDIQKLIGKVLFWFLRNDCDFEDINDKVNEYKEEISVLFGSIDSLLDKTSKREYDKISASYVSKGFDQAISSKIAALKMLATSLGLVKVARSINKPLSIVLSVYFESGYKLHVGFIQNEIQKSAGAGYWQKLSSRTLIDDVVDKHLKIVSNIFQYKDALQKESAKDIVNTWCSINKKNISIYNNFITEIKALQSIDINVLTVVISRLSSIH